MDEDKQLTMPFPRQSNWACDEESDTGLLVLMSMKQDDPDTASAAFAELYQRHLRYLYAVCFRAYDDMLSGDTGVEDLVMLTFYKAFGNASSFQFSETRDPDRIRRQIRAWLGRIAQRIFLDILRKRRQLKTVEMDEDFWHQLPHPPKSASVTGELLKHVQAAIYQLSEKEQTIIRTTFHWYRPGQSHQRLPNEVVNELAETLKTTPENLRQIRRRALAKIRDYLQKNGVANRQKSVKE